MGIMHNKCAFLRKVYNSCGE